MTQEHSVQSETHGHATQSDSAAITETISPHNRESDAFELGFQITKLRWHLRIAVYSGLPAEEDNAKNCLADLQPLLTSMFPEQRGGEAVEVARAFRNNWTLATDYFREEFQAAFPQNCEPVEVEDAIVRLKPFVEKIDKDLLDLVTADLRGATSILQLAFQLGRCVGEGLFPRLSDDQFIEVVDNPEFAIWISSGTGTGFNFRPGDARVQQPCSILTRPKQINPGDVAPDPAWPDELRSYLADVGLIGPLPFSLDLSKRTPKIRSETIQALIATIRSHFQGTSAQRSGQQVSQQTTLSHEAHAIQVQLSEAIPCSLTTDDKPQVDLAAIPLPNETVEVASIRSMSATEEGSLATSDSPTISALGTASASSLASEVGGSGHARRSSPVEVRPWSEWKVKDRIVSFRGQQKTFTQANADFLKAIVSGNRWPTVDEVCETCFADTTRGKRHHSLRSTMSRVNKAIRVQFAGLPPNWMAVRRGKKGNTTGERLLEVVMPDVGICEPS